jgi:hypothetical protein
MRQSNLFNDGTQMKSTIRLVIGGLCFISLATLFPVESSAANGRRTRYTAQQRAQIRATPILERPSRPLHFYGNTVRRNAAKTVQQPIPTKPATNVAAKPTEKPVAKKAATASSLPAFTVKKRSAKR